MKNSVKSVLATVLALSLSAIGAFAQISDQVLAEANPPEMSKSVSSAVVARPTAIVLEKRFRSANIESTDLKLETETQNNELKITFQIPRANHVFVSVFDAQGEEIKSICDEWSDGGFFSLTLDTTTLPETAKELRVSVADLTETIPLQRN